MITELKCRIPLRISASSHEPVGALVDLYQALGGGWELNDSQWTGNGVTAGAAQTPTP
jgi:hypothetical protein